MNKLFNLISEGVSFLFTSQPKTVKDMKTLCTNPMETRDAYELMMAQRGESSKNGVYYNLYVLTIGGMLIKEECYPNYFVYGEAEETIKILKEWEENHPGRDKVTSEESVQTLKNLCKNNHPSYINFDPPLYHYSKAEELLAKEQKIQPTLQHQKPFS